MDRNQHNVRRFEGCADFVEVIEANDPDACYSYDDLIAFYSPSQRRYFWAQAHGCSCSDFWSDVTTLSDFSDGSRAQLMAAVSEHHRQMYSYRPGQEAADVATVANYRTGETK